MSRALCAVGRSTALRTIYSVRYCASAPPPTRKPGFFARLVRRWTARVAGVVVLGTGGLYLVDQVYVGFRERLPESLSGEYFDKLHNGLSRLWSFGKEGGSSLRSGVGERLRSMLPPTGQSSSSSDVGGNEENTATGVAANDTKQPSAVYADSRADQAEGRRNRELTEQLAKAQQDLVVMQNKYQRELERAEQANRDLKRQLLLSRESSPAQMSTNSTDDESKSLIDMYSELLDLLQEYDSGFDIQDHLPRVVVVGDQSAGKTSVLEMIAQARIFPRGGGEMMTRSPVKVTLSEGPNHVAQFKGGTRQYDLTSERELQALRSEIERQMRASVRAGQTVSSDVISLSVRGPGLQRMVLVDLPGIISTVTTGMAADTRDAITSMSKYYMNNPNAIILCIQDGSVDAERSMVTDLARSMDPSGKRTIFVMTKMDLAEKAAISSSRIKAIMEGRLFPMKALGYFAVVTGRGNSSDSIETIRQYEEQYFATSSFFRSGSLQASQMTTRNLSFQVSRCFWQMVKESVHQQADTFRASRYNLETEWKNTFPRLRELDRNELFEKGKDEILDHVAALSRIAPHSWEQDLVKQLWKEMSTPVVERIFLPAAQGTGVSNFNTRADINLRNWAAKDLPKLSIKSGWEVLLGRFAKTLKKEAALGRGQTDLFALLKDEVVKECELRHIARPDALSKLRVIQMNTLEDRAVTGAHQWDDAVKFMESTIQDQLQHARDRLHKLVGPGARERWLYWKSRSKEQSDRGAVCQQLKTLLGADKEHSASLAADEVTTVCKNLHTQGITVTPEFVTDTWTHLYREHFLELAIRNVQDCRKGYYHYTLGSSELHCDDVVLFWRIQRMLHITANALRQQIENDEARSLSREVKQILDSMATDTSKKQQLITGRQVELAEELKRVRLVQERLEAFIEALRREKS